MKATTYLPDKSLNIVNANFLEEKCGRANDNNCRYLGGVCGNAGMFFDLRDLTL